MLLYCFLMTKRIAFKRPIVLYFHPLVIEIFWFGYGSELRKRFTLMLRRWMGRGVLEVVLPGLLK